MLIVSILNWIFESVYEPLSLDTRNVSVHNLIHLGNDCKILSDDILDAMLTLKNKFNIGPDGLPDIW